MNGRGMKAGEPCSIPLPFIPLPISVRFAFAAVFEDRKVLYHGANSEIKNVVRRVAKAVAMCREKRRGRNNAFSGA